MTLPPRSAAPTTRLGVVLLAAGAGTRLGGVPKCLIHQGGHTLLARTLGHLQTLASAPALTIDSVLVLGHHAPAIEAALPTALAQAGLPPSALRCVHNPAPGDEPADSLRLGLAALPAEVTTVMVLLADQPWLDAHDLRETLLAFQQRPAGTTALVPMVDGEPGHPVVLEAGLAQVLRATGASLRQWRRTQPATVYAWPAPNRHPVDDLDTPADLGRLRARTGQAWELPASGQTLSPPAPQTGSMAAATPPDSHRPRESHP